MEDYNLIKIANRSLLQRIANHQMMFASFMPDLGLLHGKMGVVLFFFHYARFTDITLYEDFAMELLDEICEDIHTETSIRFSNGLSGIGWGIEYLKQQGFVEGDTDEILEDVDRRIMEYDPRRMMDKTFEYGLGGIIAYVQMRLQSIRTNNDGASFDADYLREIENASLQVGSMPDICKIIAITDNEEELSWKVGLKMMWDEKACISDK